MGRQDGALIRILSLMACAVDEGKECMRHAVPDVPGPGRWVARCHDRSLGLNGAWAKGHMRLGPWFLYITFNNREAEGGMI